ncbi:DedA family protein [Alicyclobacillus cycloheptanicus]|uniref:Membrane protein DedA with SNARE-associated domain n=1 Tax=Alicyclobacillus cycloheptanicus TaxID=1457 RepID=A0ABT9XDY8_9BACL|nr:DedA family protein [Alicyclobacillus cycloheptanicus]MDQ0188511.1 membrane protein DedA with SNARE-associated domain [Alicyclobacillus cycloheptanicus]WDM01198.1 DedA family protein [Alicyclobacillus cycloheptanicus]
MAAELLHHFGYVGVFLVFLTEMLGAPFPAETTLTLCGVAWYAGEFRFAPLYASALLGHLTGSTLAYGIGGRVGRPILERYGRYVGVTAARLGKVEGAFHRRRAVYILLGKFISGVRVLLPFFAGMQRMPFVTFTVLNAISAGVWCAIYLLEGRFFGAAWQRAHGGLQRDLMIAAILLMVAVSAGFSLYRKRRHTRDPEECR